uniref:Uncharacterized protein n=1 Tax=Arundo donax TaxID=35708 RepID=A0A0A9A764_ARUDO
MRERQSGHPATGDGEGKGCDQRRRQQQDEGTQSQTLYIL